MGVRGLPLERLSEHYGLIALLIPRPEKQRDRLPLVFDVTDQI